MVKRAEHLIMEAERKWKKEHPNPWYLCPDWADKKLWLETVKEICSATGEEVPDPFRTWPKPPMFIVD